MEDYGSTIHRLADLARVVALASAVSGFFVFGLEGGVKFTLVFAALAIPRLVGGIPAPFDLAYCTALLLATWSTTAAWYRVLPWIDWPVHAVTTGAISVLAYLLLSRADLLPGLRDQPLRGHPGAVVLLTVALGFGLGAIWELYEWFVNNVLGGSILVSYNDTIADLLMDGSGSLIAGFALVVWRARGRRHAARASDSAAIPAR